MTIRIGINGFGRIGRAVFRIALANRNIEIVSINDINPDIHNLAYLMKYDSTYGKLDRSVEVEGSSLCMGNEKNIRVHKYQNIDEVPWEMDGVDIVVDSSGIRNNRHLARNMIKRGVRHCIVTNAPASEEIDRTVIMGVNHDELNMKRDYLIASSICDSNAFVPVASLIDRNFGIEHGFLTTLHPWLNYQNVLDGPSISYATPGQIHDYYALGRASTVSLIPKTTSAISASCVVLKHLTGKFMSMSYRVPTMIVSSADVYIKLSKKTDVAEIKNMFMEAEKKQKWKTIHNNDEPLVSADFIGCEYSAVVDHRWIMMNSDNYLKVVLWYDNEWGYSHSVVELIEYIDSASRSK